VVAPPLTNENGYKIVRAKTAGPFEWWSFSSGKGS
jgi:hypothetical protein